MTAKKKQKHPIIGVGVIILNDGKVLIGRRKGPRNPGEYGLPGGVLERSESIEMCATREVFEETGLENIALKSLGTLRWSDEKKHYIDFIFYANCDGGLPKVKETNRVVKWKWYSPDKLPSPLYKPTKLAMEYYASNPSMGRWNRILSKFIFRSEMAILFSDKPEN